MRYRVLGRTGLPVSELGFGCSGFWARAAFSERKALALLERVIDHGITFLDTGPNYGAGTAERRLGAVLHACDRKKLVICSKVGTFIDDRGSVYKDFSRGAVKASVQRSLERLRIDRLSVLHLHAPRITDLQPPLIETLYAVKSEGLVAFLGINSFENDVIRHALTIPLFDSFMIEFNVIRKSNATLIGEITDSGAAAVIATSIAQALFRPSMWPTSVKRAWEFGRALKHRADILAARRYRFLNGLPNMSGAQAALAFALTARGASTALFNTTSVAHLDMNTDAADIKLTPDLLQRIEALPDGKWSGDHNLFEIIWALI
jgi:aryl-alcohol dehydrogenase-like predicted oxidoreductase